MTSALTLLVALAAGAPAPAVGTWPLWDAYARYFLSVGRIVDHDNRQTTTSEGQAYALFFALVANDRQRFEQILDWTKSNLQDNGKQTLPSWQWGRSENGDWRVLDKNPASDADLWLAYTLGEAGRLWNEPAYLLAGSTLQEAIQAEEIVDVPGLGTTLLPGSKGFVRDNAYTLNPSYLPLQLCQRLSHDNPRWKKVAKSLPALLEGSAPGGFVLDWIAFTKETGFQLQPVPVPDVTGSYDAIRVYLWAGLLDRASPGRAEVLRALRGMTLHLRLHTYPPEHGQPDGSIRDTKAGVGFAASVVPFLLATGDKTRAELNLARLRNSFDPSSGLYGKPPRYYDQNLAMFTMGFLEKRYRFESSGKLSVSWR